MTSLLALALLPILSGAPVSPDSSVVRLDLVHVNDLHAHLDPVPWRLQDKRGRSLPLGGIATLKTAFDSLRRAMPGALLLHAGDQFTGTSWFSLHHGLADAKALRGLGFQAFVPGNHEFDLGPSVLRTFLDSSALPVVAANLDASRDPSLAGRIPSVRTIGVQGRTLAVVGVANEGTAGVSRPGAVRFSRALDVARTVDSLRRSGVWAVILLSHNGIELDTVLARRVPGILAVVGGHSHTRMGRFEGVSSPDDLPYPLMVVSDSGRRVPVVQAWHWGMEIGVLRLEVGGDGYCRKAQGEAFLPVAGGDSLPAPEGIRFFRPDSAMVDLLSPYRRPVDSLRHLRVAHLPQPLGRGREGELADFCAASLLDAGRPLGAQVGLVNRGGVRDNLDSGIVTMDDVQRVAPFGNTVVVLAVSGKKLLHVLKILQSRKKNPGVAGLEGEQGPHGKWKRIRLVGRDTDLDEDDTVRVAVNSYLAEGGDGCLPLRTAKGYRMDSGILDAEALAHWLSVRYPLAAHGAEKKGVAKP